MKHIARPPEQFFRTNANRTRPIWAGPPPTSPRSASPCRGGVPPPPGRWITASPTSPHPPCRGRRPRRPALTVLPASPRSARPDRACDDLAVYYAAHGPSPTRRRGRRPRRPFPAATAGPTTFLQPLVGAGFHPRARRGMTAGVRKSRGLRAAGAARKGGTPGEGSPFDPLLRFFSTRGIPRAAARGQGLRPWTPPAFL